MRSLVPVLLLAALAAPPIRAEDLRDSVPAEPGGELSLKLAHGSVEIQTHDEPIVQVDARATGFGSDSVRFELSGDGRNTTLTGTSGGYFSWLAFGPLRVHVRVHVPERYGASVETRGGSVEVEELGGSLRTRTSGGSIRVSEVAGEVDVETYGGGIQIDEVTGAVRASTRGGSIQLSEVGGAIDAETRGGSIQVHDVEGSVRAITRGGSISARFESDAAGELETLGGSIEVEFDEGTGLEIDAQTHGGRVTLEEGLDLTGRMDRDHMKGTINGGGPLLRMRTTGGSIRLRGH